MTAAAPRVRGEAPGLFAPLDLTLAPGRITCLLGESGCGKSTLLRITAGVARPDGGRIRMSGTEIVGPGRFVQPESRRIGFMFQDYALFPHLSVAENLAFVGQSFGMPARELRTRLGMLVYSVSWFNLPLAGPEGEDLMARFSAEEQRFGVVHKERLKQLKADVHVLTLTATPIPRTLQMAMSGLRELSVIQTPPVDRLAIRTYVSEFDTVTIREALLRLAGEGLVRLYLDLADPRGPAIVALGAPAERS